jgi:hypothetical protein
MVFLRAAVDYKMFGGTKYSQHSFMIVGQRQKWMNHLCRIIGERISKEIV